MDDFDELPDLPDEDEEEHHYRVMVREPGPLGGLRVLCATAPDGHLGTKKASELPSRYTDAGHGVQRGEWSSFEAAALAANLWRMQHKGAAIHIMRKS